jgi:hypothetical protein
VIINTYVENVYDSDPSLTHLSCFALGFFFSYLRVDVDFIFPFCKLENLGKKDWYNGGSLTARVYTLALVFLIAFYNLTFF